MISIFILKCPLIDHFWPNLMEIFNLGTSAETARVEKGKDVQANDTRQDAREIDLIDGRDLVDLVARKKQLFGLTRAEHLADHLSPLILVPRLEPLDEQLFALFE